jgi:LmbE family N-acetylglucosaminyl deacetylase
MRYHLAMTRRQMAALALGTGMHPLHAQPRKWKIVVTGGHPGDPEYGCGGTIARYTDAGHDVAVIYLNRGEKHCPESPEDAATNPRVAEAKRACAILKARPVFASQCDAHAVVDSQRYDEFRALIEAESPDVLFTHWPVDNHRDHRAISMLCLDAWIRLNRKAALYFYEVSDGEDTTTFSPTNYVDISAAETRKRSACYAHASQSPDKYYELQDQVARFRGIESRHGRAEAFVRHAGSVEGFLP